MLVMVTLLSSLGVWQLHRFQYKKMLLQLSQQQQKAPAKDIIDLAGTTLPQFSQVVVSGFYLNEKSFVLENRYQKGKIGYEVITPFYVYALNQWVLINRGWIADLDQAVRLKNTINHHSQYIHGTLDRLAEKPFKLGENLTHKAGLLLAQRIEFEPLMKIFNAKILPYLVRLNADQTEGFVRDWPVINMQPEKHLAYAIQWFLMSLVVIGFYFFWCQDADSQP